MVRKLVSFALYQPLFLTLLTIMFVAAGIVAFRSLPVEAFPDVTDVQTTVITLVPGRAAEEVEKQVTIPLEIALAGVPHAVRMFSHTQFGLSFLTITFDDQVDDYFARQRVLERLQQAELPPDIQPQLAPLSTPVGELYRYRLVADTATPTDLRGIEDWIVERNLKMAPGVADVVGRGGFIKQYHVSVDLARMRAHGIGLQQVFTALGRGNANAGGNYLEEGEQQYLIRGVGMLRSPDDIGAIVVTEHAGTPLLIRDVADVTVGSVPRQGLVGRNDDNEIVEGIVLMRKGENPSEVLQAIKERVDHLNASVLAARRAADPVLRPLAAHRHDADDGVSQSARGRAARADRLVRVPAQRPRRRHRRRGDSAGAARDLHRPAAARHSGQPAVARRARLRHPRRRRGNRRRERIPAAERARAGESSGGAGSGARGGRRSRTADVLLDADHHRRAHSDLHAAAPRRAHLRTDGVHGDVGARRSRSSSR
jgi:hypothetical protein